MNVVFKNVQKRREEVTLKQSASWLDASLVGYLFSTLINQPLEWLISRLIIRFVIIGVLNDVYPTA